MKNEYPVLGTDDLHWLAGLLEGEGYFHMANNWVSGKCYRTPRITLAMTDLDVVQHAALLFGTKPSKGCKNSRGTKPIFRCYATGKRAARLMIKLCPIMGLRRHNKIKEVLSEYTSQEDPNARRSQAIRVVVGSRCRADSGRFTVEGKLAGMPG